MPLRDDILNPIPGPNPAGENLRYAPLYDKIREARREDDDAPQGDWRRERKLADWPLVLKLAGEAVALKSKDLQLAAWLTEALLRREGVDGLRQGLDLLRGLVENFWDGLYPEIEDGDLEFRATPLQWVGDRLEQAVKNIPLTRHKHDWFQYKQSRAIGYEADAAEDDAKLAARQEAIAEGKITADDFDAGLDASPKTWFVDLNASFDAALESLAALSAACDERFGDDAPGFNKLRSTLEEVGHTVRILLERKREQEPDEAPPEAVPEEEPEPEPEPGYPPAARTAAPVPRKALSLEPADRDDAVSRVLAVAAYLRAQDPYSPAPYLMLRGLRWGELRAGGSPVDAALLEPPPGELRRQLRQQSLEGAWEAVLEAAETAAGLPCGRGWLDPHRYVCRACAELGSYYDPIALAVKSGVRTLLADLPELSTLALLDDTPAANPETQAWLNEIAAPAAASAPAFEAFPSDEPDRAPEADAPPDARDLALEAARAGRKQEAIEILSREISRERSGRGRFHRKIQLAELCLSIGREAIAYPILRDLSSEIEGRKLDEWEAADAVAHPLALLFHCVSKLDREPELRRQLYERICRLDPVRAMSCEI